MAAYNGLMRPESGGLIWINAMHGVHHNAARERQDGGSHA
jgi:hypothetical protein